MPGTRAYKAPKHSVTIQGITFSPVWQMTIDQWTGQRKPVPVEINGKKLYAIPGRLMAFAEDLPAIAQRLKSSSTSPPSP